MIKATMAGSRNIVYLNPYNIQAVVERDRETQIHFGTDNYWAVEQSVEVIVERISWSLLKEPETD